ncbi:MAG: translation initiation factor IF-2 [Beijerinckiaceae bacterium]|nr:translation initiation factor IF-2 [Beijerinckiaceae bacterium]
MSENNGTGDKTLSVSKTLSLKRPVEQGVVKQSFSHGRTKSVVVETVKRRPGGGFEPRETKPPVIETKSAPAPQRPAVEAKANAVRLGLGSSQQRTLTEDERDARAQVLQEARRREEEDRRRQEAERREREERDRAAAEARRREEEERRRADEAASQAAAPKSESVAAPAPAPVVPQAVAPAPQPAPSAPAAVQETRRYEPRPSPGMRQDSGMRQDQPRSAAPVRDFGTRPPRLDGPRFGRPAEGGERRPQDGAPREGGFRREGGPPRDGMRRDGPRPEGQRFEGSRPQGERPAGTVRLGFAPRPGQAPAPGSRPPGGRPPIGGAAPIEELENMRPKREIGNVPPRAPRPDDDEEGRVRRGSGVKVPAPAKPERTKGAAEKSRGRLTVTSVTSDEDERQRSVAAFKRRVQRMKGMANNEPKEKIIREVVIPETITIQELANRMSERAVDVIRFLMKQGQMHKITDVIDADTAQLVAEDLGHTVKRVAEADVEEGLFDTPDDDSTMVYRAPVVTIMGHVDHGKTSLLDAIRQTNVVSGEAGGITQHIGAYQVTSPLGGKITFIDTPGHAAFTAMRARGAKVTDIVILVVAADDGVMPQTIEAINHAKAAKVPMIVAINKIDKPEAKPERVRTELLQHDVQVESMGGDTLEIEVSAKQKLNLDKLLEIIQLQAEVLELRANPERAAEGSVIEAKLDRGRGPVATVLVQRGTLRTGDIVVAGAQWGRVRALINDKGENVPEAGPSLPVEILGFQGAPEAGDRVAVVESEARAREITNYRERQKRDQAAARGAGQSRSLVDMMKQAKDAAGRKEFPLVIKGDVQGSVEAITASVEKLGNDEVRARVLHTGVGGITESDITLASATGAVVLAFNVRAHKEARESAERAGVEIRYYNIIYDLVDDVKAAMSGLLAPTLRETMLGNAEIKQVFNITKVGNIAGCVVTDGKVERGAKVRLIRDSVVVHEGTLKTLKRFKDEVKEVQSGQECGMAFANYEDMRAGDVIECFRVEEIQRSL